MTQGSSSTCGACGRGLTADTWFCPACGAAVPKFCPNCGAPRTSRARFCRACGVGFRAGSASAHTIPPAAPGARGRRRPTAYAALVLAAVVVLAAGALGSGIVKLPGAGTSAAPTDSIESPPPIDNLATPAQGVLAVGDTSPVTTIGLDSNGASTTVSAPGQDWDGLEIDVPAGAWPGATLQVTAEPITRSSFGQLVTPISPLYTVSGAEGMAPDPVTLKIPASIPDGSFAMGFFYDASSGQLEGMPLLAEDGTSVTIATEHFSSFFLSLVDGAILPETIDSGFRPGVDDWQFPNYGSYVTPLGNCAGEVLTEAYYYIERRLKGRGLPLHGLYDNNGYGATPTPTLWMDDSNSYRLASVAHSQFHAGSANNNQFVKFFNKSRDKGFDELEYDAFRYAIAVSGEPQYMSISDPQDKNAHAILAYRVDSSGIYVADPNYQGPKNSKRLVPFDTKTGKFGTYLSEWAHDAATGGTGIGYTNIAYYATRALVNWPTLAADWAAFDDGKIGVGLFPAYSLEALAGQDAQGKEVWVPLVDRYQTSEKSLTLRIRDPKGVDSAQIEVFPGLSGTHLAPEAGQVTIQLKDGENPLGIYEQGKQPGWKDWKYVDFVRLTVIGGPAPTPTSTSTPTPAAQPTYDCNAPPPSDPIDSVRWYLHCKPIGG